MGLLIPWEQCQLVFSSIFVGDYPVQPDNLQFGTWRLTVLDVYYLTPYILRVPIHFQFDPIMGS